MPERHEDYFKDAKQKLRFSGVGGVQLNNPDLTQEPHIPMSVDPKRAIVTDGGWIMVGGKKDKSKNNSSIQILKAGLTDATKKNK